MLCYDRKRRTFRVPGSRFRVPEFGVTDASLDREPGTVNPDPGTGTLNPEP
jgi:hypothetical protein